MGIELNYYYGGSYVYFKLSNIIEYADIEELFRILSELLDLNKQFVFLLDGRDVEEFPTFSAGYFIIAWMKKHYPIIPKRLMGSAIILKNDSIISILNWVFSIQKPVSPNIICNDINEGKNFIRNIRINKNIGTIQCLYSPTLDPKEQSSPQKEKEILEEQKEKKKKGMIC